MTEIVIPPGGAIQVTSALVIGDQDPSYHVSYMLPIIGAAPLGHTQYRTFTVLDADELARALGVKKEEP